MGQLSLCAASAIALSAHELRFCAVLTFMCTCPFEASSSESLLQTFEGVSVLMWWAAVFCAECGASLFFATAVLSRRSADLMHWPPTLLSASEKERLRDGQMRMFQSVVAPPHR